MVRESRESRAHCHVILFPENLKLPFVAIAAFGFSKMLGVWNAMNDTVSVPYRVLLSAERRYVSFFCFEAIFTRDVLSRPWECLSGFALHFALNNQV